MGTTRSRPLYFTLVDVCRVQREDNTLHQTDIAVCNHEAHNTGASFYAYQMQNHEGKADDSEEEG